MSITARGMSSDLDYKVDGLENRIMVVNGIVTNSDRELVDYYDTHYNPSLTQSGRTSEHDSVSKELERLADYILYSEHKELREKNHGKDLHIVGDSDADKNKSKEYLTDNVIAVMEEEEKIVHQYKLFKKIKVYKEDRMVYNELAETGKAIEAMKKCVSTGFDSLGRPISDAEKRKLKWIIIDLQKDEVAMKESLKGYIRFKRLSPEGAEPEYDGFSFGNEEHVRIVFENYSKLKENSYDDTNGEVKAIIQTFEEIVDKIEFTDHMWDIFIMKIDGCSREKITGHLQDEYGIIIGETRLSQITATEIPLMIVNKYNELKEEWLFTYIIKGKYKKCQKCQQNKLTKYFGKNKRNKDGLHSSCKTCRKK